MSFNKANHPITYLVFGYIRNNIENNKQFKLIIPPSLKYICCEFYGYFFNESNILNNNQKHELFVLLNQRISIENLSNAKLLFRGTRDGFDRNSFKSKLLNKSPYLYIVHTNHGNICGGYTTKNITSKDKNDPTAFVYVLKSDISTQKPEIFGIYKGKERNAIYNYLSDSGYSNSFGYICHFGSPAALLIVENGNSKEKKGYCYGGNDNYTYKVPSANILCGGNDRTQYDEYYFFVIDIEIFHVPYSSK